MQEENIILKAKKLGINLDGCKTMDEKIQTIQDEMGIFDLGDLENSLDEQLYSEDYSTPEELVESDDIDFLDEDYSEGGDKTKNKKLGEDEYNAAKDENGKYDKDYYKKKDEKLHDKLDEDKKIKEEAHKVKEEAEKKKNEAKKQKKQSGNKDDKKSYKAANKEFKKAKKEAKSADQTVKNTQKQIRGNKFNDFKHKFYKFTNPTDILKDKVKGVTKDTAKKVGKKAADGAAKAGKAAAKAGKAAAKAAAKAGKAAAKAAVSAGKAIGSLAVKGAALIGKGLVALFSTPYGWIALAVILVIIIILLIIAAATGDGGGGGATGGGYYDPQCDFNKTQLTYNASSVITKVDINDFVKGSTYSFVNGNEYTDDQIKAMMIVIKTNVLSIGGYNTIQNDVTIDDSVYKYDGLGTGETSNKINELYAEVEGMLYLTSDYTGTISSLSIDNALGFNENDFADYTGSYTTILENIYNDSNLAIYDMKDNCTYYTFTGSDAYWWPIGSANPTNGNIYGGNPTNTTINSKFGWRELWGERDYHGGIDIDGRCDIEVVIASKSGIVDYVVNTCETMGGQNNDCGGSYGNRVDIIHDDGTVTRYAHLAKDSIVVTKDQIVQQGEKIALVGSSGNSSGCHLHFEVRINNATEDPLNYISQDNPRPIGSNINYAFSNGSGTTKSSICNTLLNSGFSKNAVAGIMVNLDAEGELNPKNVENSRESSIGYTDETYTVAVDDGTYNNFINDGVGYGLAQWTHESRKRNLYNFSQQKGTSIGSLEMQLEFLLSELKGYSLTYEYLIGNYEAEEISNIMCQDFERPEGWQTDCPIRAERRSDSMLEYVNNGCA